MNCPTCKFCDVVDITPDSPGYHYSGRTGTFLFCHRYPPAPTLDAKGRTVFRVPQVSKTQWCGEHKEKTAS